MAELTDEDIAAANERGRIEFEREPHAAAVRYDRSSGRLTLDLYNGCSFTIPARCIQGLEAATDDQIEAVELGFTGYGLHWEALDADVSVPGLLAGQFGTAKFMASQRARLREIYQRLLDDGDPSAWNTQAAE